MPLISLRDVTLGFGGQPLIEHASLAVEPGERIALVGRNGVGKSTLLKLLSGEVEPDDGEVQRAPDLAVGRLIQTVPVSMEATAFEIVADGLGPFAESVVRQRAYARTPPSGAAEESELAHAEARLEAAGGWSLARKVDAVLSRLNLEPDADVSTMSAGLRRRVLLGQALVEEPSLLLLDEPTNHLDIESIRWLEGFLSSFRGALVLVTHDRQFLESLSTRILEIDRGRLTSYDCDFPSYLERKEHSLVVEAEQERLFEKKLAEEEQWIRRGVKERRKRNMGRVRELEAMRAEKRQRRARLGSVHMVAQNAERTGRLVIEANELTFSYGSTPLIHRFSTTIQRRDRVGIIGPNGAGKSTLLRLLLAELEPQSGSVRHGTHLEVAYFDQLHAALDEEKTVAENVADGGDTIVLGGKPRHIIGYLQDFLFPPAEARSLVRDLSGGERNRLLLARLFARPSNLLVLDEPTNDLDVETLELLEELLMDYAGTVLLVSHDRRFLDNIATSTIVFEGDGVLNEYVGGFTDWLLQRQCDVAKPAARGAKARGSEKKPTAADSNSDSPRRLSYLERKELAKLPERIEALEEEKHAIHEQMTAAEFYQGDKAVIDAAVSRLAEVESELPEAYSRWEELEEREGAS